MASPAFEAHCHKDWPKHSFGQSNGLTVNTFNQIEKDDCTREPPGTKQEHEEEPAKVHGEAQDKPRRVQRRRGRRKSESLLSSLCQFIADHQIGRALIWAFCNRIPADML